ncbi:MAG: oligosaccharide flippase family protein [Ignavibacteriales bacterium]|nr:MAG: oligosaccharide flippase family protein [Ignavibacteriales bacterium]
MFDKIKQLSKDTAIYGISTIVGRFLNFLLVPLYTNIFPPGDYGVVANIYIFIAIMNVVMLFGMDAAYLKYASAKTIGDEKDNFSTPFISVFTASLFFSLLLILFNRGVFAAVGVPEEYDNFIYYVSAILFVDAIASLPFVQLRLKRKAKKFAAFKIINITVNVILNLYLILYLRWNIEAIFISNLAASVVSFVLLIPDVIKSLRIKINVELLKKLLKFGIPYLPAGLASMIIQGIDRPILTSLTDLNTNGIYQANHKLGIFMMLFVSMFQYAWQPFFLQQASEENAKNIFSKVLTYFAIAAATIWIVISLFINDIVQFEVFHKTLIGREYWSGLNIVPVILLGYLFNGIYVVLTAGIFIKEKSIYIPFITGLGALVNVVVNLLLIPEIGIMGAAIAMLASYFAMAVAIYVVTQKFYHIKYELNRLSKLFLLMIISGSLYYYLSYNHQLNIFLKLLMLSVFVLLLIFFIIDREELKAIKKRFIKN